MANMEWNGMREKIRAKMARAIDLYDEWYDGMCDAWQKRFDRFCHRVEGFIDRAIKTATKAIRRCLGV